MNVKELSKFLKDLPEELVEAAIGYYDDGNYWHHIETLRVAEEEQKIIINEYLE